MSPIFQSYLEKQYVSSRSRKSKRTIIKTLFRKILFSIVVLTIFSIPLLLSTMPKSIEAQKAESEIEGELCISYNKSEKLLSITCKYADFADITREITDPEILKFENPAVSKNNSNSNNNNNNKEKVWLLNAGLQIEKDAQLDINSNDVSWLKIIPTEKSPNAITVEGILKVDTVKITSWNQETNDYVKFSEEAKEDQSLYTIKPRPYIKIEKEATGSTEITNSELAYLGYSCNGCGGVTFNGGENSILKNNDIHHIYKGFYSKGIGHMLIEGNRIYGNEKYGIDPHTGTHDMIIRNNTVYNNYNAGIICSLDCYNILIEGNKVHDNGHGDYKRGIAISKNTYNSTIRENTVYNQDVCVHIGRDSHDNKVYDNILTNCREGIAITRNSVDNEIHNNKIENVTNGLVAILNSDDNKFYSNTVRGIQNEKIVIDEDSKGNSFDNKMVQELNLNMFDEAIGQEEQEEAEEQEEQQQPNIKDPNLETELIAEGLSWPTSMAFIDDNNILILEKNKGTVRLVSNGILQEEPVLEVDVNTKAERGLLGIAIIDKDAIFLYYTESSEDDNDNDEEEIKNKVYKYQWDDEEKLLVNPTLILELPATPGPDHVGGKMTIGPDNYLYAIIGDVKREGKLQNIVNGPDPDDTGVILRVNPEDGSPAPDNPFINNNDGSSSSLLNKYYAYGIRNSFGIAFDPVTDILWQTENGPTEYDEVNVVKPGFNSGWNKVMGPISKSGITEDGLVNFPNSKYADPVFSWFPSLGITDIEFLNSSKLGDKYTHNIFVGDIGDLTEGNLYYFKVNEDRTGIEFEDSSRNISSISNQTGLSDLIADDETEMSATLLGTAFGGITDIETGPDGLLYILTLDRGADGEGKIYRLTETL
jgi:aldose sugar dehydrogenase